MTIAIAAPVLSDMSSFMFGTEEDALLHQVDGEVPVGLVEVDDLTHPRRPGNVGKPDRYRRPAAAAAIASATSDSLVTSAGTARKRRAVLGCYFLQTLCRDVYSGHPRAFADKS